MGRLRVVKDRGQDGDVVGVELDESDLRVEYFHSNLILNRSDKSQPTCVRIAHIPTGKVGVGCSYIGSSDVVRRKNRNIAMRDLLSKLDVVDGASRLRAVLRDRAGKAKA